jgi:hypothetical protein
MFYLVIHDMTLISSCPSVRQQTVNIGEKPTGKFSFNSFLAGLTVIRENVTINYAHFQNFKFFHPNEQ